MSRGAAPREPIHRLVRRSAERHPERVALECGGRRVAYGELVTRADRISAAVAPAAGERVVILADDTADLVAALLGALGARAVFVPLDPAAPDPRLRTILAATEPAWVMASPADMPRLEDLLGERAPQVTWVPLHGAASPADGTASPAAEWPGPVVAPSAADVPPPPAAWDPDDACYVYFTSGSTGEPKGIVGRLKAIDHFVRWEIDHLGLDGAVRGSQLAAPGFDAFLRDVFVPLVAGGTVCIPESREVVLDASRLLAYLEASRVTLVHCVPTVFRALLNESPGGDRLPDLRHLLMAGERLPPADVARWFSTFGTRVRLLNLYGPSETTLVKLYHEVTPADGDRRSVPIGRPMRGAEALVLDSRLRPCPPGTVGEIYLRTPYRSHGYLGRDDLTARVFVPNPFGDDPEDVVYRTGDFGRELADGELEFLGRRDDQVKVQGVRVELGEVEEVLRRHPAVLDVAVAAREAPTGDHVLCGYVVLSAPVEPEVLRRHAARYLMAALVPGLVVVLDALPRTLTGKVDRNALPTPRELSADQRPFVPPADDLERTVAEVWERVLGIEAVGREDSFFALGGHSLLATRSLSRLAAASGHRVPLQVLFENPTLAAFAAALRSRVGEGAPPPQRLERVAGDGPAPLSYEQQRLWFLHQLHPGSGAYHMPVAVRLDGPLDVGALAAALDAVRRRHEPLRTRFELLADQPVQVVTSPSPQPLPRVDLAALSVAGQTPEALRLLRREARRPFDLARGPLMRALVVSLEEASNVLLLVAHHLVSDDASMGILARELGVFYRAGRDGTAADLPDLPVRYRDFVAWQRRRLEGEARERDLEFWRRHLAPAPHRLELPTDRPRPAVQTHAGAARPVTLPAALSDSLRSLARRHGATPFMGLMAGYQVLLGRWSGQRAVCVGTPSGGRRHLDTEGLIGFFVNTLPVCTDLGGEPGFAAVVERVRDAVVSADAHQELPFEMLVEAIDPLRDTSHSPIFQVWLALHEPVRGAVDLAGLEAQPWDLGAPAAKFDLSLMLRDDPSGFAGTLEYNRDLFDAATVDRMLASLRTLLEAAVAEPRRSIRRLPVIPSEERRQLLAPPASDVRPRPPVWLHRRFQAQAAARPEAVAVSHRGEQVTYGELARRSSRLARRLRRMGVREETRVGLCLHLGVDLVTAILAVLEAGGAYVPIDPDYPQERVRFLLADGDLGVLLIDDDEPPPGSGHLPVVDLRRDDLWDAADDGGALPAETDEDGDRLAYVIYTSGSTGRPKGVGVSHANVARLFDVTARRYRFGPRDVWPLFHSYSFDVSVWELWGALAHGGRLVIVPSWTRREPDRYWELLLDERATILNQTPSAFRQLSEAALRSPRRDHSLRLAIFAGEALDPASLAPWIREMGDRRPRLVNMYGITETTIHTSYRPLGEGEATGPHRHRSPLGDAVDDLAIYLLDRWGEPVPAGVPGEIHVAGAGVARGYMGRPALTAARFVPDPFSGIGGSRLYRSGDLARWWRERDLESLGRNDDQVKIRGFRVEPGEVAAVLESHSRIATAIVLPRGEGAGAGLVAWVVPSGAEAPPPAELRRFVAERLPEHMVPAAFVELAALPLTLHGKLDRRRLPEPAAESLAREDVFVAPATPVEQVMASLWEGLLEVSPVGALDDFFALGGHSLLATRLLSRIREVFEVELPLLAVFGGPTLRDLASRVEEERRSGPGPVLPPVERRPGHPADAPLTFGQQRLWAWQSFNPAGVAYNLPSVLVVEGPLDRGRLGRVIDRLVARQDVLRGEVHTDADEPYQRTVPLASFRPPLVDLTTLPADRRLEAARRAAAAVAWRPFDLSQAPLWRLVLLRTHPQEHRVAWVVHHILFDGWSGEVFARELSALYAAEASGGEPALPDLPFRYGDYAAWQRRHLTEERLGSLEEHWRQRLEGAVDLDIPTDHPRPASPSFRGGVETRDLPAPLRDGLVRLGAGGGATLFITLLALFKVLLWRWSGSRDLAVGTGAADRPHVGTERLIGFFVNHLVLRTDLSPVSTFSDLLRRVRSVFLDASLHRDLPFERVVQAFRDEDGRAVGRTQLFQVTFDLQNMPTSELRAADLVIRPQRLTLRETKFEISLFALENDGGLRLNLEYDRELFDPQTPRQMLAALESLARTVVADPETPIADLPLLSPEERRQVLHEWNETLPVARGGAVHQRVADRARRHPEAVAVTGPDGVELRYGDLWDRVTHLAARLRHAGAGVESVCAVCLERSAELVVSVLAVLESGAAFLPLDPALPEERLAFLLEDSGALLVLTEGPAARRLPPGGPTRLAPSAAPGRDSAPAEGGEGATASREIDPPDLRQLAYLIYTSGSTGRPKAVAVSHGAFANYLDWALPTYQLEEPAEAGAPLHSSISFDLSLTSLLAPLCAGRSLVLVPESDLGLEALAEVLERGPQHALLKLTPTHLDALPALLSPRGMAAARALVVGGEALRYEQLEPWRSRAPSVRVFNEYGPTEAAVACCAWRVEAGEPKRGAVPIGDPIAGVRLYVLDERMAPVPPAVAGELYIGGAGLGRGYHRRPGRTAGAFVPDPLSGRPGERLYRTGDRVRRRPDGRLVYLGRTDEQVKIRGYRVEPGEVESALLEVAGVDAAAVVARRDGSGTGTRLVAYWVPAARTPETTEAELRQELERALPHYMVPARFVRMDELPVGAGGKLDRNALPSPEAGAGEATATEAVARDVVEATLVEVWEEVLGRSGIGIHDRFLDLGGDSILALQVVMKAKKRELSLRPRDVFEHPTVAGLAEVARQRGAESATAGSSRPAAAGASGAPSAAPLTPIQRWFLESEPPAPHHHNQALLLACRRRLDAAPLVAALGRLVQHHPMLAARFVRRDGRWWQESGARPSAPGSVVDLAALPEARRAAALEDVARRVQAGFDLAVGGLFRGLLFESGPGGEQQLLLVAHHLVVDGVSWRILLDDLEGLYAAFAAGADPPTPAAGVGYDEWARRLASWAAGGGADAELEHWTGSRWRGADGGWPTDREGGAGTAGDAAVASAALDPETTRLLLGEAVQEYHARADEMVLAAVARVLSEWSGRRRFAVDVEGHGRGGPVADELPLDRTVGWFTEMHPLLIDLEGVEDLSGTLRRVKEEVRSVPGQGVGYGALRFLRQREEVARRFESVPRAQVVFNFLGRLDRVLPANTAFGASRLSAGPTRAAGQPRPHLLEVTAAVEGDRMVVNWSYSTVAHRPQTVRRLADSTIELLRRMVDERHAGTTQRYAPSDFPEASLDDERLASVLEELDLG